MEEEPIRRGKTQSINTRGVSDIVTEDFAGILTFTAIDILTAESHISLAPELTAKCASKSRYRSIQRRFRSHVHLIQTDLFRGRNTITLNLSLSRTLSVALYHSVHTNRAGLA